MTVRWQVFCFLVSQFSNYMTLDEYILQHIDEEGDYLKALYRDTHLKLLIPAWLRDICRWDVKDVCQDDTSPSGVGDRGHIADTPRFAWQSAG